MTKRAFDVVLSLIFMILAIPLWILAAIAIKLDSKGPVFYCAKRVGQGEELFTLYKFRTMVVDRSCQDVGITASDDPRRTRVGRVLRRMKIDEMPQLINVIKGQMSIVGPRPEDPRYVAHYTTEQRRVFRVRPGLASPAFIKYRHEEEHLALAGEELETLYLTRILPDKLRMDLEYVENQSFIFDLRVLAQAAVSLFT